jgi:hypothetical protein
MWGVMWGAPMILKVAVPRFLGPVRDTNLPGAQPARSSANGPTLAEVQPSRTAITSLDWGLPGALAARQLGALGNKVSGDAV